MFYSEESLKKLFIILSFEARKFVVNYMFNFEVICDEVSLEKSI